MSNTDRLLAYLQAYARKDLPAVAYMFASDVHLRDWKISVRGREAAMAETAKNFQSAGTIEIEPLGLYEGAGEGGGTVAAELRIVVDGHTELRVVDVVAFDSSGKIRAIRAYLGRPDERAE